MAVYRSRCLNSLAEADDAFRLSKRYRLDNIMSALRTVRYYRKT